MHIIYVTEINQTKIVIQEKPGCRCTVYTVSKNPFYCSDNFVRFYPILPIFGRSILQEIWNKYKCKATTSRFICLYCTV